MSDAMCEGEQTKNGPESRNVSFSAKDVRDAARLLGKLMPDEAKTPTLERLLLVERSDHAASDGERPLDHFALISAARDLFQERRRRSKHFAAAMFGEPAWDMLLTLYINHVSGERLTVSRLMRFADAPVTTGLRWLNFLNEHGLIVRENHPNDARSVFIHLSNDARRALDMYFSETLRVRR